MQELSGYTVSQPDGVRPSREHEPTPESEYRKVLGALNRTGILSILPESERLGVIGIDGKEYPVPTEDEVHELFNRNHELIETKRVQGFTKLQLTPLATPLPLLIARAEKEILKHGAEGKIFQAKERPSDPAIPTRVDQDTPVWLWNVVKEAIATDAIAYFPRQLESSHKGRTKSEVINDPHICPVPGWSVGMVEDMSVLPQPTRGVTVGGRKQLETNLTPKDYLKTLQGSHYSGETGWTYEDLLTNFLVQLQSTDQVSHEYYQNSAVWLVGSYLPSSASVPSAGWYRGRGQLDVYAYDPGYRFEYWGVRSTVRLGL